MFAHPANLPGRYANHQRVGGHVAIDDRTRSDKSVFPHRIATHNGAICPKGCTALDQRIAIFVLAGYSTARVIDVGKNHARTAEHVVLQGHVVVNRHVILNLDVVADDNLVADKHVLAKRAVAADDGLAADMRPVPDTGVLANLCAIVDDGSGMYGVVAH